MKLKDRVCIVTGGGSGIGKASAIVLAKTGARIVLVGRTSSKLQIVEDEIREQGGTAKSFDLDVADFHAVNSMTSTVIDEFGRIDVLVNSAGHNSQRRMLLTTTPEDIHQVLNSNLIGTIYCTQSVVPYMLKTGGGTIINIASIAGLTPGLLGGMVYSAAKAAVINFTEFVSIEFNDTLIRASVIIPGEVDTPILENRPVVPSRRARETMVTVEDVAEAIALITGLPERSSIPYIIIRPSTLRDYSSEIGVI